MGWQPTDVIAPLVVVYGSKGGVFIYHGTPALGNPPIFWASNEGLKDPFGNTLPSIVGIAGSAVFTAGNTQTSTSGTVTYSAAPAANVMLSSDAPAAFTDAFGNAVLAGFAAYGKSGITYYAVQTLPGADASGTFGAVITVYTAASQAGPWTAGTQLNLEGSNHGALLSDVFHFYGKSGAPAINLHSGSGLLSAAATLTASSNGQELFTSPIGNVYNVGKLTAAASAVPQTINTTGAATITGCTASADAVSYVLRGIVQFTSNAAAGNPSFQFGITGSLTAQWGNAIIWQTTGAGAGTNRFVVQTAGLGFQGPALVNAAVYLVQIDAYVTFSTTGAISLQAFTSNVADTFTINNAYMTVEPASG